jgi:hypothetical protein
MNNRGEVGGVGKFVMLFIGIVVCATLLIPIFSNQNQMTDRQSVLNETIDISTLRDNVGHVNNTRNVTIAVPADGWKATECPVTSFVFKNQSGATMTETTDYTFTQNATDGIITLNDVVILNDTASNTTYADYDVCMDGYVTSAAGRGIAGLIGLMSVLALLVFIIYYVKEGWWS